MKTKISITIDDNMLSLVDSIVDNVYIRNRSQAIEHLVKSAVGENRTAVILAGGPEKDIEIKEGVYRPTARIKDTSVIEKAVKKLRQSNFKTIYIVARHNVLTKIFEILKNGSEYNVKIEYVEEKNSNGSADSLRLLKGKLKTSFLAVYSDLVFDKIKIDDMWKDHIKQNPVSTLILTTSKKTSEKGIVQVEGNKIIEFEQKPKQSESFLVFSPIFIAESEIMDYNGSSLEKHVFPEIAKKGLLNGYLSAQKEVHIHSLKDTKSL